MNDLVPAPPPIPAVQQTTTELVPQVQIVNPVPPSGAVYKLWIDGQVPEAQLWAIMERYHNICHMAVASEHSTVVTFLGGRPDNVWISELVSPAIFVLQGDEKCSILYTNTDLNTEQKRKLKDFMAKVNVWKLGDQKAQVGFRGYYSPR